MASHGHTYNVQYNSFQMKTEENGRLPALMRLSHDGPAQGRNGMGGHVGHVINPPQCNASWYNQNLQRKVPTPAGYHGAEELSDWRQSNGNGVESQVHAEVTHRSNVPYGIPPSGSRRPGHGPPQLPLGPNNGTSNSKQVETDPVTLARRKKQIDYGKTTREYSNYVKCVPKEDRNFNHPKTPPMFRKYSRRAWDGLIKQWRLNLHEWSAAGDEFDYRELPNPSLNTSFSSETGSTSTTSSMARSSFAILQEMQRGYGVPEVDGIKEQQSWKRSQEPLFVDTSDYGSHQRTQNYDDRSFFSPPVQRPSSSLCFPSSYQHFTSGMDFLAANRRQTHSQSDLSSTVWQKEFDNLLDIPGDSSFKREYHVRESQINGNGFECVSNDLPFRFNDLRLADKLF